MAAKRVLTKVRGSALEMLERLGRVLGRRKGHIILIMLAALIAHGLILLNDGVYWDGWLVHTYIREKDWAELLEMFTENGWPPAAYLHRLMGQLPDPVLGYRLVAFAFIAGSGILIYLICHSSRLLGPWESLSVALLALTYPAYQVSFELIMLPYLLCYFLFFLAVLLAMQSEHGIGCRHLVLRIGSLLAFALSFALGSLLVYYLGFLLLMAIAVQRSQDQSRRQSPGRFLLHRLDYVLVPFVFWVAKEALFPRHGLYADYNRFQFSPLASMSSVGYFLGYSIYSQLNDALRAMLTQPALVLLILAGVHWGYPALKAGAGGTPARRVKPGALLAFGIILLILGIFPYVAVGLGPAQHGWDSRHSLLVGLPMALIILGALRLIFGQGEAGMSRLGVGLLLTLLAGFGAVTIDCYLAWQARWAKDRSILVNLSTMTRFKPISTFWIDDRFRVGGHDYYLFYEWSSIFKQAWGDEAHVGLDSRVYTRNWLEEYGGPGFFERHNLSKSRFFERYGLSEFDPAGCQATLTIRRGPAADLDLIHSDARLAAMYLACRFFFPSDMPGFLSRVTEIEIRPAYAPEAVNCH